MKKFNPELLEELSFLADYSSLFKIKISDDFMSAILYNPRGEDNLYVDYNGEDPFTPYMLSFSFLHVHLTDKVSAKEWIDDILRENVLSIEYFCGKERLFGGQIDKSDLCNLSYESIKQKTLCFGISNLAGIADNIKVRGWTGKNDLDAFIRKKDGKYYLDITYKCQR